MAPKTPEGDNAQTPDNKSLTTRAAEAAGLPAGLASDLADFAGVGMENVAANDLLVPRLTILQALSPQINRKKSEYIEGAEVGQIADVGLGQVIGNGSEIYFLPVYYRKDYLEWFPRETGKGLAEIHSDPNILLHTTPNERKQPTLPNGNIVMETAQFFGFIMGEDGDYRPAFIPMSSTQLKKARKWLTLADKQKIPGANYKAPLFWAVYKLGTADEDNSQGDWVGWTVNVHSTLPEFAPDNWREIMTACKQFVTDLRNGEARADMAGIDGNEGGVVIDGEQGEI